MKFVDNIIRKSMVYRDKCYELSRVQSRCEDLQKDNCVLAERIRRISAKMTNVSVQHSSPSHSPFRRIRVVVEIDEEMIAHGLLHGNDSTVIEYIGRDIGHRAAMEIKRANFSRWEV